MDRRFPGETVEPPTQTRESIPPHLTSPELPTPPESPKPELDAGEILRRFAAGDFEETA